VQDLFCAIWRRGPNGVAGPGGHYLLAAARNRAISHLRHDRLVERRAGWWRGIGTASRTDDLPHGAPLAGPDREPSRRAPEACREASMPCRAATDGGDPSLAAPDEHADIGHAMGISVKGSRIS